MNYADPNGKVPLVKIVIKGHNDLISIYNDRLFNGSKNVDGRPFDKPENGPTNLQIPLVRQQ
jgi:hypothetical protein